MKEIKPLATIITNTTTTSTLLSYSSAPFHLWSDLINRGHFLVEFKLRNTIENALYLCQPVHWMAFLVYLGVPFLTIQDSHHLFVVGIDPIL